MVCDDAMLEEFVIHMKITLLGVGGNKSLVHKHMWFWAQGQLCEGIYSNYFLLFKTIQVCHIYLLKLSALLFLKYLFQFIFFTSALC